MEIEYSNNKDRKIYHRKPGDVVRLINNDAEQATFMLVMKQDHTFTVCFDLSHNKIEHINQAVRCVIYPDAKLKPGKGRL